MASPMIEGRVDPHKKAHFSLHISDRIASSDGALGSYSSVKFNHKPAQTTATRKTTLTASANTCNLKLEDSNDGGKKDVFTFTGQRMRPKKSYILLFDASSQKATLEPLSNTYTFNLARRNNQDVSSQYPKIYPKKQQADSQDAEGMDDLFDGDGENDEPDPDNPFDFRHFLSKEKEKRGDDSEYNASSPDYKAGSGSAMDTPLLAARKPAAAAPKPKPKPKAEPKPRKRKEQTADPLVTRKPAAKKAQAPPAVRLDRRATEQAVPAAPTPKPRGRAPGPASSKIKSEEIVHSSDDSDLDADGEAEPVSSPPAPPPRSPSPPPRPVSDHEDEEEEDEDEDMDMGGGGLEIEVPDARPSKPRTNALASLGFGGLGYLKSPSNGPISLASAANSVEGSPNPNYRGRNPQEADGVINFGDFGGAAESDEDEDVREDRDVEPMDLGPPIHPQVQEEEDDPLYKEMMMGLADDSSEESEEE